MSYLKHELISHSRRVCSLFKRMTRDLEYWEKDFFECRYRKLLLRRQFDQNADIKDLRVARLKLLRAEEEFKSKMNPFHVHGPPKHPYSKEGIAYNRNEEQPDYVMDGYDVLEKAQYPYFFAKREKMKDEYLKLWKLKMLRKDQQEEETKQIESKKQ